MGFPLVLTLVTLNDLERCNDRSLSIIVVIIRFSNVTQTYNDLHETRHNLCMV